MEYIVYKKVMHYVHIGSITVMRKCLILEKSINVIHHIHIW